MLGSSYSFLTRWTVQGTREEVYRILDDPAGLARWWPAVWLRVDEIEHGDKDGVGRIFRMTSKGWLPYVLQWDACTIEREFPKRIALRASGDFEGEGCWTFDQDATKVQIHYVWTIRARKPLLRYASFLLKPLFAANHHWAMARGEESLRLELARRQARSADERARIPEPPGPVFLSRRTRRRLGLDEPKRQDGSARS